MFWSSFDTRRMLISTICSKIGSWEPANYSTCLALKKLRSDNNSLSESNFFLCFSLHGSWLNQVPRWTWSLKRNGLNGVSWIQFIYLLQIHLPAASVYDVSLPEIVVKFTYYTTYVLVGVLMRFYRKTFLVPMNNSCNQLAWNLYKIQVPSPVVHAYSTM